GGIPPLGQPAILVLAAALGHVLGRLLAASAGASPVQHPDPVPRRDAGLLPLARAGARAAGVVPCHAGRGGAAVARVRVPRRSAEPVAGLPRLLPARLPRHAALDPGAPGGAGRGGSRRALALQGCGMSARAERTYLRHVEGMRAFAAMVVLFNHGYAQ